MYARDLSGDAEALQTAHDAAMSMFRRETCLCAGFYWPPMGEVTAAEHVYAFYSDEDDLLAVTLITNNEARYYNTSFEELDIDFFDATQAFSQEIIRDIGEFTVSFTTQDAADLFVANIPAAERGEIPRTITFREMS